MGINKFNCEGYYDPTPYEALTRIELEARKLHTFRPVVYICSPLSGDLEGNQEKAARYCRFAVDTGYIPIAPHLYFPRFMDDANPRERDLALFMDIVLLTKCAELWVFGDNVSKGMGIEIEKAKRKGQTIRYFTENCQEVSVCGDESELHVPDQPPVDGDLPDRQGELFQRVRRGHAPGRCDGAAAVRSERKLI